MQDVKELCQNLLLAKINEDNAAELRRYAESQLTAVLGLPEEGSVTHDVDGYKIKIDQKVTRKLDDKKWSLIKDKIPEAVRPVTIEESFKLDTKGVKWLKENEPGYYKLLCSAMEEKPAKPSVKVEAV